MLYFDNPGRSGPEAFGVGQGGAQRLRRGEGKGVDDQIRIGVDWFGKCWRGGGSGKCRGDGNFERKLLPAVKFKI